MNTVRAAFGDRNQNANWKIIHHAGADSRMANARSAWESARDAVSKAQSRIRLLEAKTLLSVPATIDALLEIVPESSTQKKNLRDAIVTRSNQPSMGTYGKTALDIYNAVTDYASRPAAGRASKNAEFTYDGTLVKWEAEMFGKLLSLAS